MFNKFHALALASLLGLGAFAMPASTASAAALPYVQQKAAPVTVGDNPLLEEVSRRDRRRRGHHHHGFNHFGLFLSPLVLGGGYGYYGGSRYGYGRSSSRHAAWCHNRYRSYNPWDNTWVSYSGRVYQCHSPFRYY